MKRKTCAGKSTCPEVQLAEKFFLDFRTKNAQALLCILLVRRAVPSTPTDGQSALPQIQPNNRCLRLALVHADGFGSQERCWVIFISRVWTNDVSDELTYFAHAGPPC